MAGPCELIIDSPDKSLAQTCYEIAKTEAKRIEHKFSRYRTDNLIYEINHAEGKPILVDEETAQLIDYANECFSISNGLFDISSGVFRTIWQFKPNSKIPSQEKISDTLQHVGWQNIHWENPTITLPSKMEIDFGGIGKEYAVDRTALLIASRTGFKNILVNFGGDIVALGPRKNNSPWEIGLQNPEDKKAFKHTKIQLHTGAVTTSGDLHKFIKQNGKRYGHIINPKTGWPSINAPRQVTVIGSTCIEAGILSTLAILHGEGAQSFLKAQEVQFRIIR